MTFDGVLGLARSQYISQEHTQTVVEKLRSENAIKDTITSYKLSRRADSKNDGEITFGGMDTTKYLKKSLVTIPNASPFGFWEANMGSVRINGKQMVQRNRSAIFDTGTVSGFKFIFA